MASDRALNARTIDELNQISQERWNEKAALWDETIGAGGNEFHRLLIVPTVTNLLAMQPGERLFDVACGNGQFSRQMAAAGVTVVAVDSSSVFLERAQAHTQNAGTEIAQRIRYDQVDATDEEALLAVGEEALFDAAVCNNALMDMAEIKPLFSALFKLLRPDGRFVFSMSHPCFNGASARRIAYEENVDGRLQAVYAVQVSRYLDEEVGLGTGIHGEALPHYYFERPISTLLRIGFETGFVVDGFEEPKYVMPSASKSVLGWSNYQQLPPSLIVRMRKQSIYQTQIGLAEQSARAG